MENAKADTGSLDHMYCKEEKECPICDELETENARLKACDKELQVLQWLHDYAASISCNVGHCVNNYPGEPYWYVCPFGESIGSAGVLAGTPRELAHLLGYKE